MTNLEYLEKCRTEGLYSEDAKFDNYIKIRQVKALEIIAEELIKLNENGGVMELVKVGLND
jgi:hypothetical protein